MLHRTNPLERRHMEGRYHADIFGIFPNANSSTRPGATSLLKQDDEHQLQHLHTQIESIAALATPNIKEAQPLQITPKAA